MDISNYFVNVDDRFLIGKYLVTQKEYYEIMGENPSKFKGENLPIESISWYDAVKFCNKKSLKDRLKPVYMFDKKSGKYNKIDYSKDGYRLPDESEWTYAAWGGSLSKRYKYAGSNNICETVWFYDNSNNTTHPVGTKKPNELGIYDMSGNVWEWCNDWSSKSKILRGGSWRDYDYYITLYDCYYGVPTSGYDDCGFRIVKSCT